jgi:hypothetical protein
LRQKNLFTINPSQPVGPTRFELDDLIHSAVHIQLTSIWSLQARNKQEPRIMREPWAIKSECKSRRVIEIGLPKPDAVKQMEIGSMQLMLHDCMKTLL